MSSDNVLERLWKLEASANQLVLEGKRSADDLVAIMQGFVFGSILPAIDWQKVYDALGMGREFAEFAGAHSVKQDPSLWIVPVVKGVTCNKIVVALRQLNVDVYTYVDDLDKGVPTNDRDPGKGSYVIGFRRTVEADEENKGKSANVLAQEGHRGITLLERLLLELGYFLATGQHLDVKNVTLCAGSRDSGGDVPDVHWDSAYRKVDVRWDDLGYAGDDLRSRSAVSSNILPA